MRGKFISFEGIDGAGKSTHIRYVADYLQQRLQAHGHQVICSREPGGTPLGEQLRDILLKQSMHLETEALLMFAVRREHIAEVIQPALERGDWIISDRFTDASFAYQGGGRHLSLEKLNQLEQWVHPDLQPDITLLFDVPLEVARARLDATRELDKFEQEKAQFFADTRNEYLRRAAQFPQRFRIIDSTRSIPEIQQELAVILDLLLQQAE
ncbi:dTMP kinase [Undibacterium crateris]|uniref:dTMP kinase n=1 Tax=Undibacterium crateris TaxID=2528175 RepID=UPI0013897A3F|nr:dTMP kinase [Undibacterium crateris]NDI84320.1 dTMP kinase [Undibacterium crateris]